MSTSFGWIAGRPNSHPDDQGQSLAGSIHVNRFAGGPEDGVCIQLTLDRGQYVQLDRKGVRRLRRQLKKAYKEFP